jgi:hypothetical protein
LLCHRTWPTFGKSWLQAGLLIGITEQSNPGAISVGHLGLVEAARQNDSIIGRREKPKVRLEVSVDDIKTCNSLV